MATKNIKPIIELSASDKKQLEELGVDIERGEKAITLLKQLNINVTEIEDKLIWAKKAREMLLKDFT